MPVPKAPERYWTLKQPRQVHFHLASLVAQGITDRHTLAQSVGLSPQQVSRIINSPRFLDMVAAERLHLAEAAARADHTPNERLAQESIGAIHQLAMLRDFAGRPELQLKAASTLLKLWGQCTPAIPQQPQETRHLIIIKSPDPKPEEKERLDSHQT